MYVIHFKSYHRKKFYVIYLNSYSFIFFSEVQRIVKKNIKSLIENEFIAVNSFITKVDINYYFCKKKFVHSTK